MKITPSLILYILLFSLTSHTLKSQEITGRWYSKVVVNKEENHYLLDIRKDGNEYAGFLDLPSEKEFRIRLDSIVFAKGKKVFFSQNGLELHFAGMLNKHKEEVHGNLERDGVTSEIIFSRGPQVKRNQIVRKPTPYESEDIYFYNQDSTRLAGTITFPQQKDSLIAVVLISGSGPQNRDEEILGHKPFLILADYLSRRGIVVLRYDDRGYGESEGQFRPATSMDYACDALAAVQYLKSHKNLPIKKIGLIGHSEGGNIAPVVATMDSLVNFLVFLAAPGTSNYESYLVSLDLILQEYPETYDRDFPFFKSVYKDMATISDKGTLKDSLQSKFEYIADQMDEEEFSIYGGKSNYVESQVGYHSSDWYHYYLQFDVTEYLKKLDIPILALNGDKDISVESDFNLNGIKTTLREVGNTKFEVMELENVNHFFQVSKDDKIENVYFNEETFSKVALERIGEWLEEL